MLDEIRNHDPRPTAEERAWIEAAPFPTTTAHFIAVAVLALMVALSLSLPNAEVITTAAATTSAP